MSLIRYNTQPQFRGFENGMKQIFDQFFTNESDDQSNVVTSQWQPRVDIKEEPKRFVISADIPGVDPKDIEIHMDKGVLTLKGERNAETRTEDGKFTRVERVHGSFYRRFALPDTADADQISASGKHGVLDIVIPKKAEAAPRRIAIDG